MKSKINAAQQWARDNATGRAAARQAIEALRADATGAEIARFVKQVREMAATPNGVAVGFLFAIGGGLAQS
jgi:hypothetical protein